jgi:hypothetical protein
MTAQTRHTNPGARIALIDKVIIFGSSVVQGGSNRGHVQQSQLNALLALPAVDCDMTCGM